MLATLSVFIEGWTLAAAVHVSGLTEDRTLDLIDALARHSLVKVEATDAEPRFRMLQAIQELAAERLAASAERADVERRHAEHFGALVEKTDWPVERQAEWAERLRAEEANLATAIRWFFAHDIARLPYIFRILWLFWQMRDGMPEGRAWSQELQRRADELNDRAKTELLLISAVTAAEVGDDEGALAALEGIERLEDRIDDPYLESAAQLAISWAVPLRRRPRWRAAGRVEGTRWLSPAERTVQGVGGPDGRVAGGDARPRRRRARAPHRGQRAWEPVRQPLARIECTNAARVACGQGGPTRRGSSAPCGFRARERGCQAQHPDGDILARRFCPARAGARGCTQGGDGVGRCRWAAEACWIASLALDAAWRGRAGRPGGAQARSRGIRARFRRRIRAQST